MTLGTIIRALLVYALNLVIIVVVLSFGLRACAGLY